MCENKEDIGQYLSYSNSYYVSGIGLSILHVYLHVYITCICILYLHVYITSIFTH